VVEFGLFVTTHRWYVEGLVKAEDLGDGFVLDKDGHALVEKRSGRAYRVGDELEVQVAAADPVRRRIDLLLVEGGEAKVGTRQDPVQRSSRKPSRGERADRSSKPGKPSKRDDRGGKPARGRPGGRPGGRSGDRPKKRRR
jgi:ribonuclease R